MKVENSFTLNFNLSFPLIMAPMFLVSDKLMIQAAMNSGIMGVFPSLNFRKSGELEKILDELNNIKSSLNRGNYGVNIIVQKSNFLYRQHLDICVQKRVPFYITSLGNPSELIFQAHSYGAKVYCDVTNITHAKKAFDAGCDGFIAVGQGAGGHAGPYPLQVLIPSLKKHFPSIPVIAAGGIATGGGLLSALSLGAEAVSVGTRFIASTESPVSDEYKNAIVKYGMQDIVLTEKISGTPCAVINTPFAQKLGNKQNWIEKKLATSHLTKKYFKMLTAVKGFKMLEKAVRPASYTTLWSAGQSVELIEDIKPVSKIVDDITSEFIKDYQSLVAQVKR